MARFYFNLHECGTVTPDEEGAVFSDTGLLRERAVQEARAIMSAEVVEGRLCLGCNIEVMDEGGRIVLDVPFREALAVSGI